MATPSDMAPHDVRNDERTPEEPIRPPRTGDKFEIDENVVAGKVPFNIVHTEDLLLNTDTVFVSALPVPGASVVSAHAYGMSLWGRTAKIITRLPDGKSKTYFLKVIAGEVGRVMCEAEYESIKAIHAVSPDFAPQPCAWGPYKNASVPTFFLLTDFRGVGQQPPEPVKFTACLADLHKNSVSPTGKFGFHVKTCVGNIAGITACWESSWEVLYRKQLAHMMKLDIEKHGPWPKYEHLCRLTLDKVIPRLLRPLQSDGRSIKPCLVQGDLWDENTATDKDTGEPFIFDASSSYAHNEYETGIWRAPRHRLSKMDYIENYKMNYPASEPKDDWDARNQLYSLRFNIGTAMLIPGSNQREVVFEDMKDLCKMFCPEDMLLVNHSEQKEEKVEEKVKENVEEKDGI